ADVDRPLPGEVDEVLAIGKLAGDVEAGPVVLLGWDPPIDDCDAWVVLFGARPERVIMFGIRNIHTCDTVRRIYPIGVPRRIDDEVAVVPLEGASGERERPRGGRTHGHSQQGYNGG